MLTHLLFRFHFHIENGLSLAYLVTSNFVSSIKIYRSVLQIRPPFSNLSLSTKCRGGAKTWDAIISLAITPSLPMSTRPRVQRRLVLGGGQAKHKALPNARRRDAPDASGRLTSFSVEGRESRALPRSSWHVHR